MPERIYLDNAATSFPKPNVVYDAVDQYQRHCGAGASRGGYGSAMRATRHVDRCREQAMRLLGVSRADAIVFTLNGTDSLNMAIHGVINRGGHVVCTTLEHNSVLRPLHDLNQRLGVDVTYVAPGADGVVAIEDFAASIRPETRLVICTHASNVTGVIQPVEQIAELCRKQGVTFLVDAAQTAGHVPIQMEEWGIDILAMSGHKGLLGPLGTGILGIKPGVELQMKPWRLGGTGSSSESAEPPQTMPERFEAGNLNVAGIVGLEAGLGWILSDGVHALHQHSNELTGLLIEGLRIVPGVTLYHAETPLDRRVGVLSLNINGFHPHEAATILDDTFGIEVRSGLHCSPRTHQELGTSDIGGTVRISLGWANTKSHVTQVIDAIKSLAGTV